MTSELFRPSHLFICGLIVLPPHFLPKDYRRSTRRGCRTDGPRADLIYGRISNDTDPFIRLLQELGVAYILQNLTPVECMIPIDVIDERPLTNQSSIWVGDEFLVNSENATHVK